MGDSEELVLASTDREKRIGWITLNRPERRNAMNVDTRHRLLDAIRGLEADDDVRSVIIRGAGDCFSAGFDMSPQILEDRKANPRLRREASELTHRTFRAIWDSEKAYIAAVHGPCMAGALDLALTCDFTLCSDDALFGAPEILFGGSSPFLILPWLTGMKAAKYVLMTGKRLTAREAHSLGLVTDVVERDRLFEVATDLAAHVARLPAGTIALNKRSLHRAYRLQGIEEGFELSRDVEIVNWLTPNEEQLSFQNYAREHGLRAALRKRDKEFGIRS